MGRKKKFDGRSSDLTFAWLVSAYGGQWLQWQQYAAEWLAGQNEGTDGKRRALACLFETYIMDRAPYASDVVSFFQGQNGHRCSTEELDECLEKSGQKAQASRAQVMNAVCDFIDWVIEHHFSVDDDHGVMRPTVTNPFERVKKHFSLNETVRNPLPYRYIERLRDVICPPPSREELRRIEESLPSSESLQAPYRYRHFKDWTWAQAQTGVVQRGNCGDWFEVDPDLIDRSDPDCVWRTSEVTRKIKGKRNQAITIHQMWSPLSAMLAFVKLHLPLRTYQIRFLDSGEADTWRYQDGLWVTNEAHDFVMGTSKRPYAKGVFKRIYDSMSGGHSTGLYVSTNKTADQNKDAGDRGYTIPWQNEEVLYWLEKLRNWQEKYNPITSPTPCTELKRKHTNHLKSEQALKAMGEYCFLFRDASAKGEDRKKPLASTPWKRFWYRLLKTLEDQLFEEGVRLDDGTPLKLIEDYPKGTIEGSKTATRFPPHAIRVSLITAYTMDTGLPLPVISKLLAGHTRLLMTIYYNKITPHVMRERMAEAEQSLALSADDSLRTFLNDASFEQIQCKAAYHSEDTVIAALANRNPIGWENRATGLCLVGGNTVRSDEIATLGGCWNGGELLKDAAATNARVHAAVPHGPENCPRCRWFITDASKLPALTAHFNQLSYKAHQAANLAVELEGQLDALKDLEFFAEDSGMPFTQHNELQALQRRYEKQRTEADEYTKDWIATFNLIQRLMCIENGRTSEDAGDKLIAVGTEQDIEYSMQFMETESELLHLSLLCDDAEFHPDLWDDLRKTEAIKQRTLELSKVMMKRGYEPIFMEMDDEMQLISANAMLREMAKLADPEDRVEGYRKVAGYLEAGEYLRDHKLFDRGLKALADTAPIPLVKAENMLLGSK